MLRSPALQSSLGHPAIALAPHAYVKRAFPAVMAAGCLEAEDQVAQIGAGEPERHGVAQNAAALLPRSSLAGNNQHEARAAQLRAPQESEERSEGALLPHAVQVDARIDLGQAAQHAPPFPVGQR